MNPKVTEYIDGVAGEHHRIMETVRQLIHEVVPHVKEEFKWSRPVFSAGKDFAYLKVAKSHVTFGFVNAGKLHDPHNRLEGAGKDMRHVKLRMMADIEPVQFREWIVMLTG